MRDIDVGRFGLYEQETGTYETELTYDNTEPILLADISAAKLTLYNKSDGTIINSRNGQDILNTNDVTIDACGKLEWRVRNTDSIILSTTIREGKYEDHIALFEITYTSRQGDTHIGRFRVIMRVFALDKVS